MSNLRYNTWHQQTANPELRNERNQGSEQRSRSPMPTPDHTPDSDLKRCSKCKEWRSRSEYWKNCGTKDGLQTMCKVCKKSINNKWDDTHRDKKREHAHRWKSKNREYIAEYNARYREDHREESREYALKYYYAHRPIPELPPGPGLKRCSACKEWKSYEGFDKRSDSKDGLRGACIQCRRTWRSEYYAENRVSILERAITYHIVNRERRAIYQSQYYTKNKARAAQYAKEYLAKNRGKVLRRKAIWYDRNRERLKIRAAEHHRARPYIARAANRRRKDRIRNIPNEFTGPDWMNALAWWGGACAYCGNPPSLFDRDMVLHMDHFIPVSDTEHCPGTVPSNILPACQTCNFSKKANKPREWLLARFGKRKAVKIEARIREYFGSLKKDKE